MEAVVSEYPDIIPTHARGHLGVVGVANKHFDTLVMGRTTYDPALRIGVTSPYAHPRQYVFPAVSPKPSTPQCRSSPTILSPRSGNSSRKTGWGSGCAAAANVPPHCSRRSMN
jgi:hypothetical protein